MKKSVSCASHCCRSSVPPCAAAASFLLLCFIGALCPIPANGQDEDPLDPPLFALAPPAFLIGGPLYGYGNEWTEDAYGGLGLGQFNLITSTKSFDVVWSDPNGSIDTLGFGAVLEEERRKIAHGGVLWYPLTSSLESSWWPSLDVGEVEDRLNEFIDAFVSAGRDRGVWAYDVASQVLWDPQWEAASDNRDDVDGLRIFYRFPTSDPPIYPIREYDALGRDYVRHVFRRAHEMDPDAVLLLADSGIEEMGSNKSEQMFALVVRMINEGVPIDGVSLQLHLQAYAPPDYEAIRDNIQRYGGVGAKVFLSQLDVEMVDGFASPSGIPAPVETQWKKEARAQADVYGTILRICLAEPNCHALSLSEFAEYNSARPTARYSKLHPRSDDASGVETYTFASPFWDVNPGSVSPKPAWFAMRHALETFVGRYRMDSRWDPGHSFLGREGLPPDFQTPGTDVYLQTLDSESQNWANLRWDFEPTEVPGRYRIRCSWDGLTGYLSRVGVTDEATGRSVPSHRVVLSHVRTSWLSQMWYLEHAADATRYPDIYRVRSAWGEGRLTQDGEVTGQDENGNDIWAPLPNVHVDTHVSDDWWSQQWRLHRLPDAPSPAEALVTRMRHLSHDMVTTADGVIRPKDGRTFRRLLVQASTAISPQNPVTRTTRGDKQGAKILRKFLKVLNKKKSKMNEAYHWTWTKAGEYCLDLMLKLA